MSMFDAMDAIDQSRPACVTHLTYFDKISPKWCDIYTDTSTTDESSTGRQMERHLYRYINDRLELHRLANGETSIHIPQRQTRAPPADNDFCTLLPVKLNICVRRELI